MVKSIQVYRFVNCPELPNLRLKLGKGVTIKRSVPDRRTVNEKISLNCKLHFIDEDATPGIGGKIDFEFQAKIRQSRETDEYSIFEEYYYFYIIPKLEIIIIHGSSSHRNQVRNEILRWFQKDSDVSFETVYFSKETVKKIVDNIKKDHPEKNNIKKPSFYYDRKNGFHKVEDLAYDMYSGVCASDFTSFKTHYSKASNWDVKMRVYKCAGILPESVMDEFILDIYNDARFSFSKNISQIEWNRFILEKCKFALT